MKRTSLLPACLLFVASVSTGQNTAVRPQFDAASVKIADRRYIRGVSGKLKGGPGTNDPGRISYNYVSLNQLLVKAWDIESDHIFGPDWLLKPGYTIEATMPPATTGSQFQAMLQNLLIDRFSIRFHHETRTFPAWELIVAPGGPKLKASADPDASAPPNGATGELDTDGFLVLPPGHGEGIAVGNGVHAKFQCYTIGEFASHELKMFIDQYSGQVRNHVVDKTGLTGKYDFTLKFDARADTLVNSVLVGAATRASAASEESSGDAGSSLPTLFKAVQQQLGLKLLKKSGVPMDSLVIDQIEKVPAAN